MTEEGGINERGRRVKRWEGATKLKQSSLIPNLRSKLVNSVGKVKKQRSFGQKSKFDTRI